MANVVECPNCGAPLKLNPDGTCYHCRQTVVLAEGETALPGVQLPANIATLLQAGKKIEAIKAYRALTGASLKEALAAINARS
jgi:hypothetical protein